MSPLVSAIDRLDAAIARLKSAVDERERRAAAERDALHEQLDDMRGSHATLQTEARTIASRLDYVIERLRSVAETR